MTEATVGSKRRGSRHIELIDAAARVFYERGYDAATIQDIADSLGILKGSVYHYISSKEELLFEIIDAPHRRALDLMEGARRADGTVSERLAFLLRSHVEMLTDDHVKWAVFVNEFNSLSRERREELREARRAFEIFLDELLDEGKQAGEFRADLDVELTRLAILGMVNWSSRWYREDGHIRPGDMAEAFIRLTLDGVRSHGS